MADGEMSAADSNTSLPEKKSGYTFGHNETLLLISLYLFSDVSYKKKAIWQMIADDMKKNGYSSSSLFTRKIAAITAAMAAPSSAAIFVTQCLLMPGPRLSTGVSLCRQSELFLAFRTNHSYSRIVDKKTRPKTFQLFCLLVFCVLLPRQNFCLFSLRFIMLIEMNI